MRPVEPVVLLSLYGSAPDIPSMPLTGHTEIIDHAELLGHAKATAGGGKQRHSSERKSQHKKATIKGEIHKDWMELSVASKLAIVTRKPFK